MNNYSASFQALLAARTVSAFGTGLTEIGILVVTAVTFAATPAQLAAISVLERMPPLIFGLYVGVWLEGRSGRQVMLWTDLLKAVAMFILAFAVYSMPTSDAFVVLLITTGVLGFLNVFGGVAYHKLLPAIVEEKYLRLANSRLSASITSAETISPMVGGAIVGAFGAPLAFCLDGVSYLVAALLMLFVSRDRATVAISAETMPAMTRLKAGFSYVWRSNALRFLLATSLVWNVLLQLSIVNLPIFFTRTLAFTAVQIGAIFTCGSVGFVVAALVLPRISARLSEKKILLGSMCVFYILCIANLMAEFTSNPHLFECVIFFISGGAVAAFVVSSAVWRQMLVAAESRSSVAGIFQTLTLGVMPIGSIAGGLIGSYTSSGDALLLLGGIGLTSVLVFILRESCANAAEGTLLDSKKVSLGAVPPK